MNKSKKEFAQSNWTNQIKNLVDLIEQIKKKEKSIKSQKKFRGERIKRKSKIPQLKIQNLKRR